MTTTLFDLILDLGRGDSDDLGRDDSDDLNDFGRGDLDLLACGDLDLLNDFGRGDLDLLFSRFCCVREWCFSFFTSRFNSFWFCGSRFFFFFLVLGSFPVTKALSNCCNPPTIGL